MLRFRALLVVVILCILTAVVLAARPTFWRLESQIDFLSGDSYGVSMMSNGSISLAPETQILYEASEPFLLSLVTDGDGTIYAGSGNQGKIFRVGSSTNGSVIADLKELQVHALFMNRTSHLFAGTSPRGQVYRIEPNGTPELFFDPDDRYIWALAQDMQGNLIVATGDRAQLYRVSPNGDNEVLFTSEETHLVSLAVDSHNNIYAGSDSSGLIFKADESGSISVLFDTPFQEIRSLIVDSKGNIYAAAVNGTQRTSAPLISFNTSTPPSPAQSGSLGSSDPSVGIATTSTPASLSPTATLTSSKSAGGLFRIRSDSTAELLWSSATDMPLSLALSRDDRIMVGTSREGRVYLIGQDKSSTLLFTADADQITAISGSHDTALLSTSNPGKIYQVLNERRSRGTYRSPVKDTHTISSWGKIRWDANVPNGATLTLETRVGNSENPDNTWTTWSSPYSLASGEQITSPAARFIQWRAVLNSLGEVGPELFDVTIIYLEKNLRPEVTDITLYPLGQTFQRPLVPNAQLDILGLDVPTKGDRSRDRYGGSIQSSTHTLPGNLSRKMYRKGYQTVSWNASDPNKDTLSYEVQYRGDGDTLWRTLRSELRNPVIAWDTLTMPDGRYTLRIIANDSPSNPSHKTLRGQRISRSLLIDNTPPTLSDLFSEKTSGGQRILFTAKDAASPVGNAEYSLNSGSWHLVYPADGIADSLEESFDFLIPLPTDKAHTVVIKVTDTLGNFSTARTDFR